MTVFQMKPNTNAAFHWAPKLVFPSRKSERSQNSEFPTWKYDFRLQRNDISYWETRKYQFTSPMERSKSAIILA